MADLKEQRVCIKFCFMLGKTAAETVTMLREAFKEEALSQARVYEWFSRFKGGDMSLEDQPRSGHPLTSRTDEDIQKIRDAIMFDRRRTIDELEALTGVSWSSCPRILSDCVMLCEENAPNCGGQVSGFCTTTMLPPTRH